MLRTGRSLEVPLLLGWMFWWQLTSPSVRGLLTTPLFLDPIRHTVHLSAPWIESSCFLPHDTGTEWFLCSEIYSLGSSHDCLLQVSAEMLTSHLPSLIIMTTVARSALWHYVMDVYISLLLLFCPFFHIRLNVHEVQGHVYLAGCWRPCLPPWLEWSRHKVYNGKGHEPSFSPIKSCFEGARGLSKATWLVSQGQKQARISRQVFWL